MNCLYFNVTCSALIYLYTCSADDTTTNIGSFCGETDFTSSIYSASDTESLVFEFMTDGSGSYDGFRVNYEAVGMYEHNHFRTTFCERTRYWLCLS